MPPSRFQQSLTSRSEFTLTFELVPGRGSRSTQHTKALELAHDIAHDGRICALSVTDNAGGHAMLAPDVVGQEILACGLDVISHFSCKDKNRNKMESLLFGWERVGIRNLLVISGDYPQQGYGGYPKPVFDLDSVQAVDMIQHLNSATTTSPTSFFIGVAVSPFKLLESEQQLQYRKLQRKVAAGAHYAITQLGFDARKYDEVLRYVQYQELDLPLLGNLFIPSMTVARLMHQGKIPGCILPDSLWQIMSQEAKEADKGKRSRLGRAAGQLAILRGLGYSGAHIGGPGLTMADIDFVLTRAAKLQPDWRDLLADFHHWPDQAYYFFHSEAHGLLNSTRPKARQNKPVPSPAYRFSLLCHNLAFTTSGPLFRPARQICQHLDHSVLARPFAALEHLGKFILFSCRNCGDCTLSNYGYYCPQAGCAKYLLNGPCGGSQDGWCEVYPGLKRCHYVRAYERLSGRPAGDDLVAHFIPPRDWSLNDTSAWLNFYNNRDHHGRQGADPPD